MSYCPPETLPSIHCVAICETASTWINDAAFAFTILKEAHADDWMDHVSNNHVMGTRLADEDEARISATEGTNEWPICSG